MDIEHVNNHLNDALVAFHDIIDGQLESISALEAWLDDRCTSDKIYKDVASAIETVLVSNKALLSEARRTNAWPSPLPSPSYYELTWTHTTSEIISVTGLGEHLEIRTDDHTSKVSIEAFMSTVANAFESLAATESQIGRLALLITEREICHASGSAARTVRDHIQLLGQYNDLKDVGQQLIGLIAENRGVPVGSLYQQEEYGVSRDD